MIKQGVDEDPVVDELLSTLPKPFLKRLQPETAATAIANGLAHRSPRITEPSRWKPISALRGLLSPAMDSHLARDRRTLAALSQLDARSHPVSSQPNTPMSLHGSIFNSKGTK
jgi:hypothetical protein